MHRPHHAPYTLSTNPRPVADRFQFTIDRGHRLLKTIPTVSNVDNVKGVAVSAAKGKLYVTYRTHSGVGMIYCLSIYEDAILWNRVIDPESTDCRSTQTDGSCMSRRGKVVRRTTSMF
jgi:hypothetical protein